MAAYHFYLQYMHAGLDMIAGPPGRDIAPALYGWPAQVVFFRYEPGGGYPIAAPLR